MTPDRRRDFNRGEQRLVAEAVLAWDDVPPAIRGRVNTMLVMLAKKA